MVVDPKHRFAFRVWGWVLVLAILTGGTYGLLRVARYLFPGNAAINSGLNPVVISQFGTGIDPGLKLLRFELHPYTGFHAPGNTTEANVFEGTRYTFRTNAYGFLTKYEVRPSGNEPLKRGPDDRVVLLTGGSAAWGWGATANDTTAASVLEAQLNRADPRRRWHVVNLAMAGWIAYQEAIALDLYGRDLEPDWVIVFDGRNDILVPTVFGERVPNPFMFSSLSKLSRLVEDDETALPGVLGRVTRYRAMSRSIVDIATPPPRVTGDVEVERAVQFYLHAAAGIANTFADSRVLFVTQPTTLYARDPRDVMSETLTRGYDALMPRMRAFAEQRPHVQHVNSASWFQPPLDQFVVDDCHLNDRGHAVVAARLAELILGAPPEDSRRQ